MLATSAVLIAASVSGQDKANQSSADRGKLIYEQHCLACHQADGSGVPSLAPPLIEGQFVGGESSRLIQVVLNGMEGIEIKGEYYANPMPPFNYLSDEEIADVLTYVRANFRNNAPPVTAAEVKAIRNAE